MVVVLAEQWTESGKVMMIAIGLGGGFLLFFMFCRLGTRSKKYHFWKLMIASDILLKWYRSKDIFALFAHRFNSHSNVLSLV